MKSKVNIFILGLFFAMLCRTYCQSSLSALPGEMVFVEVGEFNYRGLATVLPANFYISKYEVTRRFVVELTKGNSGGHPGSGGVFCDACPNDYMTWFQCCVLCNHLSTKFGLEPCYYLDESLTIVFGKIDSLNFNYSPSDKVYWKKSAKGFRLPMAAEWEFAAIGGTKSRGTKYSGSNNLNEVGWYNGNSGGHQLHAVGQKLPNELGLYDMSGNIEEYCFDLEADCTLISSLSRCWTKGGHFWYDAWFSEIKRPLFPQKCDQGSYYHGLRLIRSN